MITQPSNRTLCCCWKEVNLRVQIRKDVHDIALNEKNQNSVHHQSTSVFKKKSGGGYGLDILRLFLEKYARDISAIVSKEKKLFSLYCVLQCKNFFSPSACDSCSNKNN